MQCQYTKQQQEHERQQDVCLKIRRWQRYRNVETNCNCYRSTIAWRSLAHSLITSLLYKIQIRALKRMFVHTHLDAHPHSCSSSLDEECELGLSWCRKSEHKKGCCSLCNATTGARHQSQWAGIAEYPSRVRGTELVWPSQGASVAPGGVDHCKGHRRRVTRQDPPGQAAPGHAQCPSGVHQEDEDEEDEDPSGVEH